MKTKTGQVFIKVDSTYSAKNGLEKSVSSELFKLDNVICSNLKEAKNNIKMAIETGTTNCPTSNRCKPLRTEYWSHSGDSIFFRVNDVIRMSLHPVFTK